MRNGIAGFQDRCRDALASSLTHNRFSSDDYPEPDSIAGFLEFWLRENPLQGRERAEFENYYRSYLTRFSAYVRSHFVDQTREITALIKGASRPRVLEVGAGCGTESLWFAMLGAEVTGIDVATERLDVARTRQRWLESRLQRRLPLAFLESSLFDFQPVEPFDFVWMEMAYHHLEPRERVFAHIGKLLRPGGAVVICEVNGWNPMLQGQFFIQRGWKTRVEYVDAQGRRHEYGNERITTPRALRRELCSSGFTVTSMRHFRMLPNSDPPAGWLPLERALLARAPLLSTHFNTVATRGD